jgi:beta-carotene 3-hydroxylase
MVTGLLCWLGGFLGMEGVAWTAHKYLMHGPLWFLHRDHHRKESAGFLERNDLFFLVFALPGILLLYLGVVRGYSHLLWLGLGITSYGMAYFLVHDIFIHRRMKWFGKGQSAYMRMIRRAHRAHHKHLERQDGECFGMLWVPLRFFKKRAG